MPIVPSQGSLGVVPGGDAPKPSQAWSTAGSLQSKGLGAGSIPGGPLHCSDPCLQLLEAPNRGPRLNSRGKRNNQSGLEGATDIEITRNESLQKSDSSVHSELDRIAVQLCKQQVEGVQTITAFIEAALVKQEQNIEKLLSCYCQSLMLQPVPPAPVSQAIPSNYANVVVTSFDRKRGSTDSSPGVRPPKGPPPKTGGNRISVESVNATKLESFKDKARTSVESLKQEPMVVDLAKEKPPKATLSSPSAPAKPRKMVSILESANTTRTVGSDQDDEIPQLRPELAGKLGGLAPKKHRGAPQLRTQKSLGDALGSASSDNDDDVIKEDGNESDNSNSSGSGSTNSSDVDRHESEQATEAVNQAIQKRLGSRRFSEWETQQRNQSMALGDADVEVGPCKKQKPMHIRVLTSGHFDTVVAIFLLANAVVTGAEVEASCQGREEENLLSFHILNLVFCALFSSELIIRILGSNLKSMYTKAGWQWAWFDTIVVGFQLIEIILTFITGVSKDANQEEESDNVFTFGPLLRVARVIRVVRSVRVMRFFRQFRILLTMILGTLKNGLSAILLLVMIMYIFGIIFAQAVVDRLAEVTALDPALDTLAVQDTLFNLQTFYGTIFRAMFTLFKSIIGGLDWHDVCLPLADCGWVYVLLYLVYIIFVQLVVMNVVTGLFLQTAIEQAQQDQEHGIQMRLCERQTFVTRLTTLFQELDSTNDGSISLQEFEAHLQSEHMQALLQTFEIENADAWTFFKLLDADGGGCVDLEEFVAGCIRLKGPAKSMQIQQLMYHHKWIMDQLVDLGESLNTSLEAHRASIRISERTRSESFSETTKPRASLKSSKSSHM